jgi:uncharacterized membrane protein (UPF0127 family)
MLKNGRVAITGLCLSLIFWWAYLGVTPARGQELSEHGNPLTTVSIGKATVKAEVVATPDKLYRGLSFRKGLPEGRGMLFALPERERQVFCMRAMEFPIDIIWIARGQVLGLEENVSHLDQAREYCSPGPVDYVLEVPAGFSGRHGIKAGDRVSW